MVCPISGLDGPAPGVITTEKRWYLDTDTYITCMRKVSVAARGLTGSNRAPGEPKTLEYDDDRELTFLYLVVRVAWVSRGRKMTAISEDKREAIIELCRRFGVVRLHIFGSAVRDDFRPGESDVDLLVDFGRMDGRSKAHAYFDLLDELRRVLGTDVDLVMTGAVKNHYLARDIEQTKKELYAA